MIVDFHRGLDKAYQKLPSRQRQNFKARLAVFIGNRYSPELNNHALKGAYGGYRSINISGDLGAIFIEHGPGHVEFVYIGKHAQLYK